ncbi:hypothetical protein N0V90_004725 [Kalmusia sp. IMI 367209]|nr:hypothetical protein N0V90_004725 [Kalmusia sp. IMI 367209]
MPLTPSFVRTIFAHLTSGDSTSFFANVSPTVEWTVTGSAHPLAGTYKSKAAFVAQSWDRIGSVLKSPMKLIVVSVLVSQAGPGMSGRAVVELKGVDGVLKNGKAYNNEYCWVVRFDEEGLIAGVRAYLDTAKLNEALALE